MAERDGAAVAVQALVRDADAVAAVDPRQGEGFVELPEVDVARLLAGLLEELRYREHGADAHLARIAARHCEAAEDAQRLQPALRRLAIAHHHCRAGAVGELAR